jgi:hypothetical protein
MDEPQEISVKWGTRLVVGTAFLLVATAFGSFLGPIQPPVR